MTLLDFYRLEKAPFHTTPDPEFIILNSSHKEALAAIIYGIKERRGIVAIIGEVGLGKTITIRSYLRQIEGNIVKAIYMSSSTNIALEDIVIKIFDRLDVNIHKDRNLNMLKELEKLLMDEHRKGNTLALIIDEAQNLPVETLKNIRVLSNLETDQEKLIQIVLSGQPELEDKLDLHELRQLKQCIAFRTTFLPLTPKESMTYIQERLAKVSLSQEPVFAKGALNRIIKQAAGIPRIINILCDNAIVTGFGHQRRPISAKIVREVIADFEAKRTRPWLRRSLAFSAAVLVLLGGLVALSPYRHLVLPPTEPLRFPQASHRIDIDDKTPEVVPSLGAGSVLAPSESSITAAQETTIQEKNEASILGAHTAESPVQKGEIPQR